MLLHVECTFNGMIVITLSPSPPSDRFDLPSFHWTLYKKRCDEAGIDPNPRCIPRAYAQPEYVCRHSAEAPTYCMTSRSLTQSTLDNFTTIRWSKEGLTEHLVRLCVEEDEVCIFCAIILAKTLIISDVCEGLHTC